MNKIYTAKLYSYIYIYIYAVLDTSIQQRIIVARVQQWTALNSNTRTQFKMFNTNV